MTADFFAGEPGAEQVFEGLVLSPGVCLGRACLFNERRHSNLPMTRVPAEGLGLEKVRLEKALAGAVARMEKLIGQVRANISHAGAEIFTAQKMILEDADLRRRMIADLETGGVNAETAVMRVLDAYESRMLEVDDAYIKERASDLGEIKRRLLDALGNLNPSLQCSEGGHCRRGRDRVVVAQELTPGLTVDLDFRHTMGFVTERGGAGSHAAILAQGMGIPAVSGVPRIHSLLSCGAPVLIDGNRGRVVVWPSDGTLKGYPELRGAGRLPVPRPVAPVPALRVMANLSNAGEADEAVRQKAEGVGLFRTEFEFFAAGRLLDEGEQAQRYLQVVRRMKGLEVTFRLLDVGGDKSAPFFDLQAEANPYLGLRGGRLLLARPALLRVQARALARVAETFPLRVLYPMVVDVEQFVRLKTIFCDAAGDSKNIRHGAMFEVPSACLQARDIFAFADFGSVGTNDLVQYLFAVDRNNERVAYDYNADRPVFWSLLRGLVREAKRAGKPLSVCGQLAENPAALERLLAIGVDTVSVSPRSISRVRSELLHRLAGRGKSPRRRKPA